jgi:excinuclease ABC subunit A
MPAQITIRNARLHNLKNITLSLPKEKLIVFTGLSGSGKSTLAFDILYKEGQRNFMESLGMVAFKLSKPPIDSITGLSPTISINQNLTNHSPRSTVGTSTDVYTYLRILFARLGRRICLACGGEILPIFTSEAEDWEAEDELDPSSTDPATFSACPHCGAKVPELRMAHFSFNKPAGACPTCTGLGAVQQVNLERVIDQQRSILDNDVTGWDIYTLQRTIQILQAAARHYGFAFDPALPVNQYSEVQRDLLFYGVDDPHFTRHFPGVAAPALVSQGHFEGVATTLRRRYAEHIENEDYIRKMDEFLTTQACPDCLGTRLRPESRSVTVSGITIVQASRLPLDELELWLKGLPESLTPVEMSIAEPILIDLEDRIQHLIEVGLGYLALERTSPTLSAGEGKRLRLAALLGSGLTGVLYILDEPTIGLHSRDTRRLIAVLRRLRDLGNTVLVVEHDLELIRSADYVVDFGPGAGRSGGEIVAVGKPSEIINLDRSLTGDYLAGRRKIAIPHRRTPDGKAIVILGASEHNLRDINVRIPLGVWVAVSGVSGSGKSTLMFDILDRAARQHFFGASDAPGKHTAIEGWEAIDKIITIDQEPIGRIPRSNAATYSDAFTPIRETFAATAEAQKQKLTARHFSFNVPGGRCERCEGAGVLTVKMQLLPDFEVRCPVCHGRRFTSSILAVHYQGYDISQVLEMTVTEALALFSAVPAVAARLRVLADVGLGYLQLGQPATTLSGGEAQRVKLAKELGRRSTGRTLYLLDEPTTGLHVADTAVLISVLQRLVDAGNTVVTIEHNLDVIKSADWVIDLGPEGGAAGGELIAEGTPEDIANVPRSHTGQFLRSVLQETLTTKLN